MTYIQGWKWENEVPVWDLVPFIPSISLPSLSLPSFPSLRFSLHFLCVHSFFWDPSPNWARRPWRRCELPHRKPANKLFLAHSESKITYSAQILRYALWSLLALQHASMVFLTKEVAVWFWAGQTSADMAYCPIPALRGLYDYMWHVYDAW